MRESISLVLKEEISMKRLFSKIDKHLKVKVFKKGIKKSPKSIVIMINGQILEAPVDRSVSVKDGDKISILRVIAGG